MARKARQKSESGIYHVMLRGINKQNIFFNVDDFVKMMYILHDAQHVIQVDGKIVSSDRCTIYAYCILDNHLHILIREGTECLSDIMKKIEDRYAIYYNVKYDRVGHLFQGRFPSEPVNDADYFHRLLRYIHRNPVKALEAKTPEEYPYSSWNEYVGHKSNIVRVLKSSAINAVLTRFPLAGLTEWVNYNVDDHCLDMDSYRNVISDQEAHEILADISKTDNPEDFRLLDPSVQMYYLLQAIDEGVSVKQATRLSSLTEYQIRKALQRKDKTDEGKALNSTDALAIAKSRIKKIKSLNKITYNKLYLIAEYLYTTPNATCADITKYLDLPRVNAWRLLVKLLNENIITIDNSKSTATYNLAKS